MDALITWYRARAEYHGMMVDWYTRHLQGKDVEDPTDSPEIIQCKQHAYEHAREAAHYGRLALNEATRASEMLKTVCIYCGFVHLYDSVEQRALDEGGYMLEHIATCEKRPEKRLFELLTTQEATNDRLRAFIEKQREDHRDRARLLATAERQNDELRGENTYYRNSREVAENAIAALRSATITPFGIRVKVSDDSVSHFEAAERLNETLP